MLKDFTRVAVMPQEVIKKYKDQVPEELVQIWEECGLGTFLDGYLKVINPDEYLELVQETYFRGGTSIPIFVTAFGDVITWEKNEFLGIIKYKDGMIILTYRFIMRQLKNMVRLIIHSVLDLYHFWF